MRHKRGSSSTLTLPRSEDGKTSPQRATVLRRYAAFVAVVIAYSLFRFVTIWQAARIIQPTAPHRQPCWHTSLNTSAGAAPCHDFGVPVPAGNAKVALLFLVRHNIPTEPIWTAFIASAAELSLKQSVAPNAPQPPTLLPSSRNDTGPTPTCETYIPPERSVEPIATVPMQPITNTTRWLQHTLNTPLTPRQLYERQDLFSIYVHRTPGYQERVATSIFYGRDIEERVAAAISQPSLVSAHKALLRAALKDPRNTMFVLVSDVCVPLHHPALLWSQLMAESHISRVSALSEDEQRWWEGMEYGSLTKDKFSKSSQWVGLTRMHAMLVVQDDHVWPRFDKYCRTGVRCGPDLDLREGSCIADEHFVATVLAVYEQHSEATTAPHSMPLTHLVFPPAHHHPTTFMSGHFKEAVVAMKCSRWRGWEKHYEQALASTKSLFQHSSLPSNSLFWGWPRSLLQAPPGLRIHPMEHERWSNSTEKGQQDRVSVWGQGEDDWSGLERTLLESATPVPEVGGPATANRSDASEDSKKPLDYATLKERLKGNGIREKLRARGNDPNAPPILRGVSNAAKRQLERRRTTKKIKALEEAMRENLARDKWLGRFKPLNVACPLLGRRVSVDAVSEWASKAWDCDGLGFSWKCIQQLKE